MKIRGIGCSMPERVVTNAEILQELMVLSDPFCSTAEGESQKHGQCAVPYFRQPKPPRRNNGDRAYDYAHRAVQQALDRAQMKPAEIDLLIYVGVGRGGWSRNGHIFSP